MDKNIYVTRFVLENSGFIPGVIYSGSHVFARSTSNQMDGYVVEATFVEQANDNLRLFWLKPSRDEVLRKAALLATEQIQDIYKRMKDNPYFDLKVGANSQ